jgi:hypothetical protein
MPIVTLSVGENLELDRNRLGLGRCFSGSLKGFGLPVPLQTVGVASQPPREACSLAAYGFTMRLAPRQTVDRIAPCNTSKNTFLEAKRFGMS